MRSRILWVGVLVVSATIPVLSNAGSVTAFGKLAPNEKRCFSVNGSAGDGAFVNLTPALPDGPGDGKLISSDVVGNVSASNVNYRPGAVDPNVAVATIGADGRLCYVNSRHTNVHLVADHLGTVSQAAYTPARPGGEPDRRVDTRLTGSRIRPSGSLCFTVSGQPGDAAVVNLTPVGADAAGDGKLISSDVDDPPTVSNVNFRPGLVDPNVAIAAIGADNKVCFINSVHSSVDLVADHLGTIAAGSYSSAKPTGSPDRRVDTRTGLGGGKVGPSGRLCFTVGGSPGDAAVVNLTPVMADGAGNGQLVSSDIANPPLASNVNFRPGSVDPNVAIAPIGSDGKVCYVNSVHTSVHLVADHLGTIAQSDYSPARSDGAPDRRVDTRTELPTTTTTTTTVVATTTTTVPTGTCHPSYPTVCIPPPPPDLNCGDIPHRDFTVLPPDPHGFDGNHDGIGCAS